MSQNQRVADARAAVDIAKDYLTRAGYGYVLVKQTTQERGKWTVMAESVFDKFKIIIDEASGKVESATHEQSK